MRYFNNSKTRALIPCAGFRGATVRSPVVGAWGPGLALGGIPSLDFGTVTTILDVVARR